MESYLRTIASVVVAGLMLFAAPPVGRAQTAKTIAEIPTNKKTSSPSDPARKDEQGAPVSATGVREGTDTAPASGTGSAPPPTSIYRVGVGDVLDVRLLNQGEGRDSTLYSVMAGGLLEYPLAGRPLIVAGLTTDEIGARLEELLKRRAVSDRPQVLVSVREYTSHSVLVSGLADSPGAKILRREAVPLYVIIAESQPKSVAGRATVIARDRPEHGR